MPAPLTGRKVAVITVSAFGVIIAVNLALALSAVHTFPGLETGNSYVASQHFDAERTAQKALGWTVAADADGRRVRLDITDAEGHPARLAALDVVIGRPTHVADDVSPEFRNTGATWTADAPLEPGRWALHLTAEAEDGTRFRQRLRLWIRDK